MPTPFKDEKKKKKTGVPEFVLDIGDDFDGTVDGTCARKSLNDLGNAERLQVRFGEDLMYVPGRGWFWFDGRRWSEDDGPRMAQILAQETARLIRTEAKWLKENAGDQVEWIAALRKFAKTSGNSGPIAAMQREAAPHLTCKVDDLDQLADLLCVENGTLVLGPKTEIRSHHRDDLLTRLAPVRYVPEAGCPVFDAFLEKILPDRDVREFIQRFFGYMMTGHTTEQVVLLLHGDGGNGKSSLLECLAKLLGDYAMGLPFRSLLHNDRGGGGDATPDIARLPGARFVRASEPETGSRLAESMIKTMTGGEAMTARNLNEPFFEFYPQFKLVLSFNPKPSIRGGDDGIWRRLLMVEFKGKVDEADVGPLFAALADELPGILNWLIAGYEDWQEVGLRVPQAVRDATDSYRAESDPVGNFLTECTSRQTTRWLRSGKIYAAYELWCKASGLDAGNITRFGKILKDKGLETSKSTGYVTYRLELLDEVIEAFSGIEDGAVNGSGPVGPEPPPDDGPL